ncbi:DUF2948 family protein [Roseicitreum antarcticum]|uniref:DUF2948 family protein n=1 Tax=Roseicitreum antarcticum TaxID=564137 RepID=A0A1H2W0E2_9RHOB|nr:DUF2948 family protein [Roseicitreum antarcticum]SDW74055.1 Protein of unknown function [Roseicitreum antarcticum]
MNNDDARFEDGAERPLRLQALDADDLAVVSALCQDAVLPGHQMQFDRKQRRFALLLNRFRWEEHARATRQGGFERVQAVLTVSDVLSAATDGITPGDRDTVLSLLSVGFTAGDDGTGRVLLTFAGNGAVALDVECLDVTLTDVTRPYLAPAGKAPSHKEP